VTKQSHVKMCVMTRRVLVPASIGRMPARREPIVAARVVLEPVTREQVERFVVGDFAAVRTGEGWPFDESVPGSPPWRLSLKRAIEVNWLVTIDGVVIGDCFTHGGADEAGDIEIGYALAEPYRRQGYGTELVAALSAWLLEHEGIERVVARNIVAGNVGSRRVLERVGFELEWDRGDVVAYALTRERMAQWS
jgi:RimJ/RimL family protein N-acetyltransferase